MCCNIRHCAGAAGDEAIGERFAIAVAVPQLFPNRYFFRSCCFAEDKSVSCVMAIMRSLCGGTVGGQGIVHTPKLSLGVVFSHVVDLVE